MSPQPSLLAADVAAPPRAGQYRVVYSDPPWAEHGGGQTKRGADRHYPLMKTRDICALPVSSWAADDAHLYMWVTNNFLPDGLEVMKAWGFRYVTKIDWFKGPLADYDEAALTDSVVLPIIEDYGNVGSAYSAAEAAGLIVRSLIGVVEPHPSDDNALQVGLGQYFRGVTESCLFGVRGGVEYRQDNGKRAQGRTGFHAPRGQHSAKPETMRQMIERVSHGPYLEMFARRPVVGDWDVWGNQAPGATV